VRSAHPTAPVLFVVPTDAWWAYATNGSHDYHGWRTGYDGSVGYAPTVMSSRQHRLNNFFYSLYERFNDIYHLRYLDALAAQDNFGIEYVTQHDVARGRVRLEDYRLVLIGNHCEFTTEESYRRFSEYLGRGGSVMIHGGDSFAVRVEYLPSLEDARYLWQRGHLWIHLSDQASDFIRPILLPDGALPDAPILDPTAGQAIDYLNVFHTTVAYWIPGSKAVISNTAHPILRGLNLKLGDEVSGPWGGEVDIPYEPQAWDILIRSDQAAPDEREFGIDAYDPTPFHRVGLAVHKNLRLGLVCGENYPNILHASEHTLFRELYRRTLHFLLDGARRVDGERDLAPPRQRDSNVVEWMQPVRIAGLRYELPAFIDFADPEWHRKAAPYAHYVVESSTDGQHWVKLVDRRHGPWRGMQTDAFPPREVKYLRFDGTFSTGQPFHVSNVQAFEASQVGRVP
jgi:N,N-dimethylformamidase beta subunit-like protein